MTRYLIVNADDFGLSAGVNQGIIECAQRGILTSASLMVRWRNVVEAAAYARQNRGISVGLHVDLGEWVLRKGQWEVLYKVVDTDDVKSVKNEIERQLTRFRHLVGRNPTHLDSHQHVHRNEPARSIMIQLAQELGVPLRECDPRVRYCGDFYGQGAEGEYLPGAISVTNLKQILKTLAEGVTELGCHPGYDDGLESPYRAERAEELRVLCDPSVPAYLDALDISLRPFDTFSWNKPIQICQGRAERS